MPSIDTSSIKVSTVISSTPGGVGFGSIANPFESVCQLSKFPEYNGTERQKTRVYEIVFEMTATFGLI